MNIFHHTKLFCCNIKFYRFCRHCSRMGQSPLYLRFTCSLRKGLCEASAFRIQRRKVKEHRVPSAADGVCNLLLLLLLYRRLLRAHPDPRKIARRPSNYFNERLSTIIIIIKSTANTNNILYCNKQ